MSDSLSVAVSSTQWLIREAGIDEHPARARRAGPTNAHKRGRELGNQEMGSHESPDNECQARAAAQKQARMGRERNW